MLLKKRVVCVLPAYNAEKTIEKTIRDVSPGLVDLFVVVDDCSKDSTTSVVAGLKAEFPIELQIHKENRGYGANQKTCYDHAVNAGADIVVMLHPDYQYEPKLLLSLVSMTASGVYDIALGSRILGKGALSGGMPLYKYLANRLLTFVENILIGQKLSEYHTGYRAYSRKVLEAVPYRNFSDDFVFDNEFLVHSHLMGFRIGEISVPTKYFEEASSISFSRSLKYGLGVLRCSGLGFLLRMYDKFNKARKNLSDLSLKLLPPEEN